MKLQDQQSSLKALRGQLQRQESSILAGRRSRSPSPITSKKELKEQLKKAIKRQQDESSPPINVAHPLPESRTDPVLNEKFH